jgi:hypothetical protein
VKITSSQREIEFLFTFKSTIGTFILSPVKGTKYFSHQFHSELTLASLLSLAVTAK